MYPGIVGMSTSSDLAVSVCRCFVNARRFPAYGDRNRNAFVSLLGRVRNGCATDRNQPLSL